MLRDWRRSERDNQLGVTVREPVNRALAVSVADFTRRRYHRDAHKNGEQSAKSDGDPGVRFADAVLTTRQAAVTLTSGSLVNSNEAVYLVQLVGHFTLTDVSIPPNGKAPTGSP